VVPCGATWTRRWVTEHRADRLAVARAGETGTQADELDPDQPPMCAVGRP